MSMLVCDPIAPDSVLVETGEPFISEEGVAFTAEQLANFGKFVRWSRKQAGYTQEELAALMGVNISYIRMLEAGRRLGSTKTYLVLGRLLNQRPGKFLDVLSGDSPVPDGYGDQQDDNEIEEAMNILSRLTTRRKYKPDSPSAKLNESITKRAHQQNQQALEASRARSRNINKHVE